MSNGLSGHQPQPLPHHRHANSNNEPSWQRRPLPKIVPPWKATDGVLGSMDSVCALFYVFYWVFPRAKSKHTKSKRRGRKDSFLSFDDANKFVQLLTTLSTTIHGNHSGEILALRGGSLGKGGVWVRSVIPYIATARHRRRQSGEPASIAALGLLCSRHTSWASPVGEPRSAH